MPAEQRREDRGFFFFFLTPVRVENETADAILFAHMATGSPSRGDKISRSPSPSPSPRRLSGNIFLPFSFPEEFVLDGDLRTQH